MKLKLLIVILTASIFVLKANAKSTKKFTPEWESLTKHELFRSGYAMHNSVFAAIGKCSLTWK